VTAQEDKPDVPPSASTAQNRFEESLREDRERREQRKEERMAKKLPKRMPRTPQRAISPATSEQRALVKDRACVVCGRQPCDPAHLVDRSLAPLAGDDPRAVVPLCRATHHREFDEGQLDLSAYLEPHWRESIAWAVEAVGLFPALRRITKRRWQPVEEAAA
jgi:hypothetical protein